MYGFISSYSFAQTSYDFYNTINSGISSDYLLSVKVSGDESVCIGGTCGLSRFDGNNWANYLQNKTIYDIDKNSDGTLYSSSFEEMFSLTDSLWSNISLPFTIFADSGLRSSIYVAQNDDIWYASKSGIAKYDGNLWTMFYEADDDPLSYNDVLDISIDKDNNTWVVLVKGILFYNNVSWSAIDIVSVDGIEREIAFSRVAVDNDNVKWFCSNTGGGLASFDGISWKFYTSEDGLIDNNVYCIGIDDKNNKWFGTDSGVSRYDGVTWKSYTCNDLLLGTVTNCIDFGNDGSVWLVTSKGAFHFIDIETGIDEKHSDTPISFDTVKSYPNPFNLSTIISFTLQKNDMTKLSVYNISGQRIKDLLNCRMTAGKHSVAWNGENDKGEVISSGVYIIVLKSGKNINTGKLLLMK